MNVLRRLYGADGYTDLLGWRHSYAGMLVGALSLAAAAVGIATELPLTIAICAAVGLVLSGLVDTVVATRWRPEPPRSSRVPEAVGSVGAIRADLPKVVMLALSGCALLACALAIGVENGFNLWLALSGLFFAVGAVYFTGVLALARRWVVELNDRGFPGRG